MLTIRKVKLKDQFKIKSFFDSLSQKSNEFFNRTGQNRKQMDKYFLNQTDYFIPFLAELDSEPAGLLFLYNLNKSVIWLSIGVADKFQGKGIGKKLMSYAKKYALCNNKGGILLCVHPDNVKARNLYKKSGYEKIGVSENEDLLLLSFSDKK